MIINELPHVYLQMNGFSFIMKLHIVIFYSSGDNLIFSNDDKNRFLKAFTEIIKSINGKGPKNIYIKYYEDEMHVVLQGVVTEYERYLIETFGSEAIDIFTSFYQRDCLNTEYKFLNKINENYHFSFYKLEADFLNDIFVYKMKIKHQSNLIE